MKRFFVVLMSVLFLGAAGMTLADEAMMSSTPVATPGKMMKSKKKMKKKKMMKKAAMKKDDMKTDMKDDMKKDDMSK